MVVSNLDASDSASSGKGSMINNSKYRIKFPVTEPHQLEQNEAFFYLIDNDQETPIRFHDYDHIYKYKGLYEQLFYDRLKCNSPRKVCDILNKVLKDNHVEMTELRVLDLGAGNGMFGEQLYHIGVARTIGIDICDEARLACERDHPGVYDAYYIQDFCNVDDNMRQELAGWQLDCLSCVAALGFGDIPAKAFANAYNIIANSGWVAFNIKETFLLESDKSGFSTLVKALLLSDSLEVHHLERYRHRISIDGRALFYYALVGRKEANIPDRVMASIECLV